MLLPEELRMRRLELNISQAEVARRLDLSQQTISRWETGGGSAPGPQRIVQLADVLHLDPGALLRSAGYINASDFITGTVGPLITELGRMSTTELVMFIDAGWQQLRGRLSML